MSWRALSGLGLALAACGGTGPSPASAPKPVIVNLQAPGAAATVDDDAKPNTAPVAAGVRNRVSWYGLSVDLSDAWRDESNYTFEATQAALETLSFEPSSLQPEQVDAWLEEVRQRVDGMLGAKPSVIERYENSSFAVTGVRIRIKSESLYDLFVVLDDRVQGITAKCRAECDATVRDIVRSLSKPEAAAARTPTAPYRYSVRGLVFDSGQPFEKPHEFMLLKEVSVDRTNEYRVFCSRTGSAPEDGALPSQIHWSMQINEALAQLPRTEETLVGRSDGTGTAAIVRLYHREGYVRDELGETVLASSSSAVIATDGGFFACHLRAVPSSPELFAQFRRLFQSARREQALP